MQENVISNSSSFSLLQLFTQHIKQMKRKFLKQLLQEQIFENLIARNMIVIPKHAKTNNNRTGEATVFRKLYGDEIFNNVNSMNVILEEYYLDYFMMPSTFYDECYNIGFCFNVEDDHLKIQNPYYWKVCLKNNMILIMLDVNHSTWHVISNSTSIEA